MMNDNIQLKSSSSASIEERVDRGKIEFLSRQNMASVIVGNLISPLIMFIFLLYNKVPTNLASKWLTCALFLFTIRSIHGVQFKQFAIRNKSLREWKTELILFASFSGFFWAATAIFFIDINNPSLTIIIVLVIFAHIAAASSALGVYKSLYATYAFSAWGPTFLFFIFSDSPVLMQIAVIGVCFSVGVYAFVFNADKSITETLHLRYDNLHLLRQLREQKLIAEDANRGKSRFLAAASHDLRQPLHAMGLFVDALSQKIDSPDTTKILSMLHGSMNALNDLFDSVLDISKLDAGAIRPEFSDFDLKPLLQKLIEEYIPQTTQKNIQLRYRIKKTWVHSDPMLVERILRNLIGNAIKYTEKGGILIAIRTIDMHARIEIWDTGLGINESEQKNIFKEFHQVTDLQKGRPKHAGIGLGLSIVQRAAKLLKLKVGLQSEYQRGTKFYIEFQPIQMPSPNSLTFMRENKKPLSVSLNGFSVLIVDDEPDIRIALEMKLKDWGCRVAATESLSTTIEALDKFNPDILLTDYSLRNNETGDLIINAVQHALGYEIPSIIITGNMEAETLHKPEISDSKILYKPVDSDQLKRQMIKMLNL